MPRLQQRFPRALSSVLDVGCAERGLTPRVGDVAHIPYDTGAFDLVVLRHVLEHTPAPRRALAEVSRVLTAHGLVLIAVPDLAYWKGARTPSWAGC